MTKRILYIGQCEFGSTSRMRFEKIRDLFKVEIDLIDLTFISSKIPKLFKSLGWRFKIGPLVYKINSEVVYYLSENDLFFDVIWIDKGVFLTPITVKLLKSRTDKLIHFTPDPAFLYHRSRYFTNSVCFYDHCITTKSFEIEKYKEYGCKDIIYCTQGFDELIHKPYCDFENKIYDVCFIGHYEKNRADIIQSLIDKKISVVLGGIKWEEFVKKNRNLYNLHYVGSNVICGDYSKLISQSRIGLGLLSKLIPEKHTTRTFEIPACGTALLTEENSETIEFFDKCEAIFYTIEYDIYPIIFSLLNNTDELRCISDRGFSKVHEGDFSYSRIMENLFRKIYI